MCLWRVYRTIIATGPSWCNFMFANDFGGFFMKCENCFVPILCFAGVGKSRLLAFICDDMLFTFRGFVLFPIDIIST